MGSWTMGNYKDFISKNEDIIRPELRKVKDVIVDCLESYRVAIRNRLFHRKFCNDWGEVEYIRKNTIFLYVVLLGMLEDKLIQGNPVLLNVLDVEYDHLFYIIDKDSSRYYSFVIDGKEYCIFEKEPRIQGIIFEWNGLIRNSIYFKKLNYGHYERVEISSKNMPSKVWSTDTFGNKIKLLWISA